MDSNGLSKHVVKIRFVVHTMGLAGWDTSRNHWSIFLILEGETSSVRLNMSLVDGGDENGTLTTSMHPYIQSNSGLMYFDYNACANLTVGHCLGIIQQKGRHRYRMAGSGNGCRYWAWNIFLDFSRQGYIVLPENGESQFGQRIQTRYHRNAQGTINQIPDPMEMGEFF